MSTRRLKLHMKKAHLQSSKLWQSLTSEKLEMYGMLKAKSEIRNQWVNSGNR